jgi:hypothetical protein
VIPVVPASIRAGANGGRPDPGLRPSVFLGLLAVLAMPSLVLGADELPNRPPAQTGVQAQSSAVAAVEKLKFPGIVINLEERCVDVEASVCLRRGLLELVACTKGTKEHESIVVVGAKAMHLHAALLLLGASPGSPATRQQDGAQGDRWIDVPPRGGPVDVFLVLKGEGGRAVEHPISEFILRSRQRSDTSSADPAPKSPSHTFLFAGSVLQGDGPGPRRYLSDESGNVISLSTFGDEVLCLPAIHSQDNSALLWQVNPALLPEVGSSVLLRLRPQRPPAAKAATNPHSPSNPIHADPRK